MDKKTKTIAFDLDNTLCACKPGVPYREARPLPNMIRILKQLKREGHKIIIFTARGMSRAKTRQQAEIMYWNLTITQLEKWKIPYDFLIMGKPDFDLVIDDKAVNSRAVNSLEDVYAALDQV